MLKALITKRMETLLSRIEKIADEIVDYQIEKEGSSSIIQQTQAGVIPPQLIKKFRSIQIEITMLKTLGVV